MNKTDYISDALRTESCDMAAVAIRLTDPKVMRLLHAAQGMVTEAGEFMDMLKKHIWYGKPLDEVNLIEELGDGQWYHGIACDVLNTTFEEVQERNIAKLKARYPEKFTEHHAENRDLSKERTILEKVCAQPGIYECLGCKQHFKASYLEEQGGYCQRCVKDSPKKSDALEFPRTCECGQIYEGMWNTYTKCISCRTEEANSNEGIK